MVFPRFGFLAAAVLAITVAGGCNPRKQAPVITEEGRVASRQPDPVAQACAACHQDIFDAWRTSQHANANRLVSDTLDRAAFDPPTRIAHGSFVTSMRRAGPDDFTFTTVFSNGAPETFRAEAVIGITPLRQYLVPFPGGRLQVMDISYDPRSNEWFNAFGEENRQPHEWGHWRGRSMTWNVQCAFCHMTGFEKRYDPATDAYASTWKAMGISCTQCHRLKEEVSEVRPQGSAASNTCPMVESAHPVASSSADTQLPSPATAVMDNCASCHARREELFGTFKPGDSFDDHFRLTLPDQPGIFHADGQVLAEDFEYASFMMSRMGHKGVTCLDCHDPHSGQLVASVDDNSLCMKCHTLPGLNGAIPIDPATHTFHKPGVPGSRCVDCHMPVNVYMVRDGRRDHGFTSPDPRLTIEHGIPNACNGCHTDQTPEWADGFTRQWYGDKMNRRARERARAVARYHAGDATVVTQLLHLAASEEINAWRAALVGMLSPWRDQTNVLAFLRGEQQHPSAWVRSAALRSAEEAPPAALDDARALVRLDAAMIRYERYPQRPPPRIKELRAYIDNISDQPAGALRQAHLASIEGRTGDAEAWLQKTIEWDQGSALPRYQLGRFQFDLGRQAEAVSNLHAAAVMENSNAEFSYALALALSEAGRQDLALAWLEETVRRNPQFGRAWYNTGLAYAQAGKTAEAVSALTRAQALMPGSGDPAYARATVHLRMNQPVEALAAVDEALAAEPGHAEARSLRNQLRRDQ